MLATLICKYTLTCHPQMLGQALSCKKEVIYEHLLPSTLNQSSIKNRWKRFCCCGSWYFKNYFLETMDATSSVLKIQPGISRQFDSLLPWWYGDALVPRAEAAYTGFALLLQGRSFILLRHVAAIKFNITLYFSSKCYNFLV